MASFHFDFLCSAVAGAISGFHEGLREGDCGFVHIDDLVALGAVLDAAHGLCDATEGTPFTDEFGAHYRVPVEAWAALASAMRGEAGDAPMPARAKSFQDEPPSPALPVGGEVEELEAFCAERDTLLLDRKVPQLKASILRLIADNRALQERVRVVEGERDAAYELVGEQMNITPADIRAMRAESALTDLRASVARVVEESILQLTDAKTRTNQIAAVRRAIGPVATQAQTAAHQIAAVLKLLAQLAATLQEPAGGEGS